MSRANRLQRFVSWLRGGQDAVKRSPHVIYPQPLGGGWGEPPPAAATAVPSLYVQSEAVYAAVRAYANRTSSAPLHLYRATADGEREELLQHPVLALLANPNPVMTRTRLLWHVAADLQLAGNAYWFLAGPNRGAPSEIWRLNPRRTRVVLSQQNYIDGYVTEIDGRTVPLDANEVIHFRQANPFDDHDLYGLSTLAVAAMSAQTGYEMAQWNRSMFRQGHAVPAGIVAVEEHISDQDFEALKREWRSQYGGSRGKRTAFMRGGKVQFEAVGLSQRDVDFLEGSRWQAEQVYRVFGTFHLLPSKYADDRKVNERQFLEEQAWPFLIELSEMLSDQLAPFFGPTTGTGALALEFEDIRPRERALELEEQQERAKGLTLNEWRAERGLEPLDGGDDVLFTHVQSGSPVQFELDARPPAPSPEVPAPLEPEPGSGDGDTTPEPDSEDAQERAERRESAGDEVGDEIGDRADKAVDLPPEPSPEAIGRELAQWQRFVLKRLDDPEAREFVPEQTPPLLAQVVQSQLKSCQTANQVRGVFDAARALLDGNLPVFEPEPIPDPVLADIERWRDAVPGKAYAEYVPSRVPRDTQAYAQALALDVAPDELRGEVFEAVTAHYQQHHAAGSKAIDLTAASYRNTLYELISNALMINGDTGESQIDKRQFRRAGRRAIEMHFRGAYFDGLTDGGVRVDELDEDEERDLKLEINTEQGYWNALSDEVYGEARSLYLEALELQRQSADARHDGDEARAHELRQQYLQAYSRFLARQQQLLNRVDLWVNKGLQRIYGLGKLSAQGNQMMKWVLGATEEHCETCLAAAGQCHRARSWRRSGIMPQSDVLMCGGFHCDCRLEPTTERASGSLSRIPTKG